MTAIEAPPPPPDEVAFGSRLCIRAGTAVRIIQIVGDDEADPATGRIPISAPLKATGSTSARVSRFWKSSNRPYDPLLNPLLVGGLRRYAAISADVVAGAIASLIGKTDPGCHVHQSPELGSLAAQAI